MTPTKNESLPEPMTASMCPSPDYAKGWNDCIAALTEAKQQDSAAIPPVPYDQHEREVLKVIDERDHRESIIDQLCDAVLGVDRHEWSSAYHYEDAVTEVQERIASLNSEQQDEDDEEAPTPSALDIRYAQGFAAGIKSEEHRAKVAKQMEEAKQHGPGEVIRTIQTKTMATPNAYAQSPMVTNPEWGVTVQAPQVEAKQHTGEGFVLVPRDLRTACDVWEAGIRARNSNGSVADIWAAMIAAAAKPSGEE